MKQSEILMVRKAISDTAKTMYAKKANSNEWVGLLPLTPFLKKGISREEVDNGFWLVHDTEDKCWYVIDKPTGLMVTKAPSSSKAKKNFELIRSKAFQARDGKGYEEAKKRLLRLQDRPIWDPKKESEEEFAKHLAGWEKSYMEEKK